MAAEHGEFVDMFARVLAVGNAKSKVKVKCLEKIVPEEVPLYHSKAADGLLANCELDTN